MLRPNTEQEEEVTANKICNIEQRCTKTVNEHDKPLQKWNDNQRDVV